MKPYTEKIDKITETVDDVKKLASGGGVGGFIQGIFWWEKSIIIFKFHQYWLFNIFFNCSCFI